MEMNERRSESFVPFPRSAFHFPRLSQRICREWFICYEMNGEKEETKPFIERRREK